MSDSMASRVLRMDPNQRSSFESSMTKENSGIGSYMEKQVVKSKPFATKDYPNKPKTLEQASFSKAQERNTMSSKNFNQADRSSREQGTTFATRETQDAGRSASQQAQVFGSADQTFATRPMREAERAQQRDNRPVIDSSNLPPPDPTYTEDDIRRILNRR